MSKIIYVAGPYRATEEYQKQDNIRAAEVVARQVWQAGYYAFCPHLNTRLFGGLAPDKLFLDGGLEFLRRADAVILVPGWEQSQGTLAEIEEAMRLGIPIYKNIKDVPT